MKLRPFFSFFGSKWRIAGRYPPPAFGKIVSPFAGSAGYETRYASADVRLADADPVIVGVWQYLIRTPSSEIRLLPLLHPDECLQDLVALPDEARWLIGFWLNKGTAHPCTRPSAWMRDPRYASQFWGPQIRERIARQVEYIRHWRIQQATYESLPNPSATWFIDAPYSVAGKSYVYGADRIEFADLSLWCQKRSGQVIVCENAGASWLPFRPLATAKAMHGLGRSGRSREMLWLQDAT